jgi:phage virion morphogenesis protein
MKIDVNGIAKVEAKLLGIRNRANDIAPVLAVASEDLVKLVSDAFKAQVDPSTGAPWEPLAESTVRQKAKIRKPKMLVRTSALMKSVNTRTDAKAGSVFIGTNVPYAGVHQNGFSGAVTHPGRMRGLTKKAKKQMKRKKNPLQMAVQRGPSFTVNMRIPARSFLPSADWFSKGTGTPQALVMAKIYSRVKNFLLTGKPTVEAKSG